MIISLNDSWRLSTDPDNLGREQAWYAQPRADAVEARVPYPLQAYFPDYYGVVWYWHTFTAPTTEGVQAALLRFWAVDYAAEVWLNGIHVGGHAGSETPFTLDVTKAIRLDGENVLAVRVLNPTNEPIDGIVLAQTPHRNKSIPWHIGGSYNVGGIMESVELLLKPALWIENVYAEPDPATGIIRITAQCHNTGPRAKQVMLNWSVETSTGERVTALQSAPKLAAGTTSVTAELQISQHRLWELHDPFLYRISVQVADRKQIYDQQSVRCGFRDFRVIDGFFHLNGRRIFLRSTHTGNHVPEGQLIDIPQAPDLLRRDLFLAKSLGYNMVRFISGMAHPWQLDLCDELGLMVYEECLAAWLLQDSPHMAERFDAAVREMILRDRNHPSITIWGMLNETRNGPVFQQAVACLDLVRSLDSTRLVLLSSGRWDAQPDIGSVSNPGSPVWEHMWGGEAPNAPRVADTWHEGIPAYIQDAGDVHAYPSVPHTPRIIQFLRTVGANTKPIFLSEYGIGSTLNAIREFRLYEQHQLNLKTPDATLMRQMAEKMIADWDRFKMAGAYAFPEEMLLDSQRLHSRQRLLGFDAIRSNPNICGYNLTGMLDHAMTGEGAWTFWRELKPGVAEALSDGWAPLRWCLFVEPLHVYRGRAFTVEAVLANEDVLPPGTYPVRLRIIGPQGIVWSQDVSLEIPAAADGKLPPLAVPVFKSRVTLDVPAGRYELVANMARGAAPAGGRLAFHVSAAEQPTREQTVTQWHIGDQAIAWLAGQHVTCVPFEAAGNSSANTILIGDMASIETPDDQWDALWQRVSQGAIAVVLVPESLKHGEATLGRLPMSDRLTFTRFHDWLYHKECVTKAHPVFDGLPANRIMDWDFYGQVVPNSLVLDQGQPEEVAAAAFAVGYTCPGGYTSGLLVSTYSLGRGKVILSTLRLLENLDANPAADRLLLNLIAYADQLKPSEQ